MFKDYSIPEDPILCAHVPSLVHRPAASPSKHKVIVMVLEGNLMRSPNINQEQWDLFIYRVRELILNNIEARMGLRDLRSKVASEIYETPPTWQAKLTSTVEQYPAFRIPY